MRCLGRKIFVAALAGLVILLMGVSAVPAADPIVIGAPLATAFLYGWDAQRAMELAVEEINAAGGVKVGAEKRPFKLEVIDTRDLEPGGPGQRGPAGRGKVDFGEEGRLHRGRTGPLRGGPGRHEPALQVQEDLHPDHRGLSRPSTTPWWRRTNDKFKYCFRISGEAKWMVGGEIIPALLGVGKKHNLNKLFIMVQDVAHGRAGGALIAKIMKGKGWEVLDKPQIYPTGTTDFSMGLLKAKKMGAQIILIWMDMPETSILLKQWYDLKVPALPFGSIIAAAEQPGFWDATEGKGEYCLANVVNAGNAASEATPLTMKFFNAYQKKWNIEPEGYGTSSSYQAVYTLKDAIERAGTLDSDKVVTALETTDMVGVYGQIKFNPKSHQVVPSNDPKKGAVGTLFQWQDKKRVVVFPESIAKGEILLPPWMGK